MSVNKVILLGRISSDVDSKFLPSGDNFVSFTLATNETWKDKSGDKHEKTEWNKCVAFKGLAETISKFCNKGDLLYLEGKLNTRKYTNKDDIEKYITEVVIIDIDLQSNKKPDNITSVESEDTIPF